MQSLKQQILRPLVEFRFLNFDVLGFRRRFLQSFIASLLLAIRPPNPDQDEDDYDDEDNQNEPEDVLD